MDTTPTSLTPVSEPITVNATAGPDQLTSAVRSVIIVAGTLATAFGATKLGGQISGLLTIAGPIAVLISLVMSQLHARSTNAKMVTMADALPNHIAKVVNNGILK